MTIRHHISDPLLTAYAAGTLPEAFGLVVATHLSLCDDCRARAGAHDAVGGALLSEVAPVRMADHSLDAVMARLDRGTPIRRRTQGDAATPAPLADYIGGTLNIVKWQSLGMGVRQSILPTDRLASARLLYIPAGQAVPDHGHRGMELTLVLQGAFTDATDHFGPGDIEIATEDLQHTPVAEPGQPCICLAATDAPLRFRSLIPRLAQPFFRI